MIPHLVAEGSTVILTTHYMFEADGLCATIAIIHEVSRWCRARGPWQTRVQPFSALGGDGARGQRGRSKRPCGHTER